MALFHINFFSQTLFTGTTLNVILPTPNSDELLNPQSMDYFKPGIKYQTLYLLHGGFGDYSDWVRYTSIEKYAQQHKVAVVMPSAANSFYQNMEHGGKYFTFISEEVPRFVQTVFPLSAKREDNFVAGLSMGGYGTFHLATACPDKFAAAASLSGAVDIFAAAALTQSIPDSGIAMSDICADFEALRGTSSDIIGTLAKLKAAGAEIPKLYQGCGTADFTLEMNRGARDQIKELGVDLTYVESPGGHTWDYWDENIKKVLEWMPLKRASV